MITHKLLRLNFCVIAGGLEKLTIFDSYFPNKYSDLESAVAFVGRYWNTPEADRLYGLEECAKSN
jgi:hypothetical protein